MKAIVLCAGYGKRLRPHTIMYQKAMIPLHGKPLLEYIINGIKSAEFNDFIIVVGYQKEQIVDYFQDGRKLGIKIKYIEQELLNGTGGALLLCENLIEDQHFFLTWGDTLVCYKIYKEVHDVFKNEHPDFILVTNYVDDPYKGAAIYCEGNYCLDIIEKPPKGTSYTNLNNAGVFILSKEIFKVLKTQEPSQRGEIEVPVAIRYGLKNRNWRIRIVRVGENDFFGDCGDRNEYEKLTSDTNWLNLL
ncbi:MAG: nucleotidyltransferase family protein [Promethearchaeota archaeon]